MEGVLGHYDVGGFHGSCFLLLFSLGIQVLIGKAGVDLGSCFHPVLLACAQACFEALMALMLWFPFSITMFMTDESSYLPGIALGTLFVVDVYLFWPGLARTAAWGADRRKLRCKDRRLGP
ncbi:unnamed protein product [Symbiodinium natans]|uniref:Uncharacterized protein n=1 Tax=Symbiodinium natans TaxID=878477 RepID=A0A812UQ98_9DINO|nr:unnamed protein product [Symbiodinium natans]